MEKYINAVLLTPEIKEVKQFYSNSCKSECLSNNLYFGYGEEYMTKCNKLCDIKYERFLKNYERIKQDLEEKVQNCMSTHTYDNDEKTELRKCILTHQEKAFEDFNIVLDKMLSIS